METEAQICPFFQPVLAVDTCSIRGYEVLGRKITSQGVESLGEFFHDPAVPAEKKLEVDRLVRRKALEVFKQSGRNARLFLNIQPQWLCPFMFQERKFPTLEYLEEYGINADQIVVEISETEFCADVESLSRLVARYREAGCRIAVDDVGRGLNNLERIIAIRPDFLKVDTLLVRKSTQEESARYLLEALGYFAEKSGLSLILEGIEDAEVLRLGLEIGARCYQGFFLAPPAPYLAEGAGLEELMKREIEGYVGGEIQWCARQWCVSEELERILKNLRFSGAAQNLDEYIGRLLHCLPAYCFRIYVCDSYGYQKTPDFTRNPGGGWTVSSEYINRNWSWRPYFLRGITFASRLGKGIASEPYFDLETRLKIWTFCYFLGEDLYLFIDSRMN
ncbi:MAG: EAL domain-containing protein [Armatimonadetes bacterium]|nr:EAL domain-containing protein [Armatimonadota bacterium]